MIQQVDRVGGDRDPRTYRCNSTSRVLGNAVVLNGAIDLGPVVKSKYDDCG